MSLSKSSKTHAQSAVKDDVHKVVQSKHTSTGEKVHIQLNSVDVNPLQFDAATGRGVKLGLSTRSTKFNTPSTKSDHNILVDTSKVEEKPVHLKMFDKIKTQQCQAASSKALGLESEKVNGRGSSNPIAREPTCGELLTARVSLEYGTMFRELRKENPPSKERTSEKQIPASHEDALRDISKQLQSAKEHIAEIRSKRSREYSFSNSPTFDFKSDSESDTKRQEVESSKPKEKPFGANNNVHTLGCFQNETSKTLKSLGGRKVGFQD